MKIHCRMIPSDYVDVRRSTVTGMAVVKIVQPGNLAALVMLGEVGLEKLIVSLKKLQLRPGGKR